MIMEIASNPRQPVPGIYPSLPELVRIANPRPQQDCRRAVRPRSQYHAIRPDHLRPSWSNYDDPRDSITMDQHSIDQHVARDEQIVPVPHGIEVGERRVPTNRP